MCKAVGPQSLGNAVHMGVFSLSAVMSTEVLNSAMVTS